jgi:glycosyltransferase involved in cell wall biosynthesis
LREHLRPELSSTHPAADDDSAHVNLGLRRRACLLAASRIASDARVRRQGDALADAGWDVTAIGFADLAAPQPAWPIVGLPPPETPGFARRAMRMLALVAGGRMPPLASAVHARAMTASFWKAAAGHSASLYIANDWPMLPLGVNLAQRFGGVCVYDSHELATAEHVESQKWRAFNRPYIRAIEARYIGQAAGVLTVSDGIADQLQRRYALAGRPTVIRNIPAYRRCAFRTTGDRIRVLYHGIVAVGRGLEAAIDSVGLWRPEFDLTIRGPDNADYGDALRRRIRDAGLDDRVRLVPPVPMTELVREATAFDIGFFALPGHSRHNEFALPNKFFEYLMAGLALCVSDLPEMTALVRRYRLGVLMPGLDPATIAATVNGLNRELIDQCKRNALAAAAELCWERESARLISAFTALLKPAVG